MADSGFIVPPLSQYVTLAILSLCWFCSKALLLMGFAVQLLQWHVLPWADTVSVGDRDLLWDVPMQTCLLSCACSAIGVCTSALCSGKPLLLLECSPSCRYRQWRLWITGVGTSWQVQMSLCKSQSFLKTDITCPRCISVHLVNLYTAWNLSSFLEKCCEMKSKAACLLLLHKPLALALQSKSPLLLSLLS